MSPKQHVYAVVRVDLPESRSIDEVAHEPGVWITVKEIVPTLEEADAEVHRLNELNVDKGCVYFAQVTRFYPVGRGVGWPPEKIDISLSWGEAVVLFELLRRYHESGSSTLTTERADWRTLVLLLGQLERNGAAEVPDYEAVLADARRELGSYDGVPF